MITTSSCTDCQRAVFEEWELVEVTRRIVHLLG
jgi:hypothetical protein